MVTGLVLLVLAGAAIFLGLAERVLDRLHLTDRQALVAIVLMIVGSFVNIPIWPGRPGTTINVGGALVPLFLAVYVLIRADTAREKQRAIVAAAATFLVLLGLIKGFAGLSFEEGHTLIDPIYLFGLVAGIFGYLTGRSRRGAFVAAVLAVVGLDLYQLAEVILARSPARVSIGGAGMLDATILAGVLALGLAEIVGEAGERLTAEIRAKRSASDNKAAGRSDKDNDNGGAPDRDGPGSGG